MPDTLRREIQDLKNLYWSERDPDGRAFAPLADALRRAGDLGPAIDVLAEGLDRLPDFVSGHVVAGWVHRARGSEELAETSFRRALGLDPDNVSALRGLGFMLVERGQAQEAAELFRRLDEREPGDPDVQATLLEIGEDPTGVIPIELLAPESDPAVVPIEMLAPDEEPVPIDALAPGESPLAAAGAAATETLPLGELDEEGRPIVPIESLAPDVFTSPGAEPVATGTEGADTDDDAADPVQMLEEDSGEGGDATFPRTRTMAELYASQGLHHRAMSILDELLEASPGNPELREQRDDLRRRMDGPTQEDGSGLPG